MNPNEYLQEILKSQELSDDSHELKELQAHREDVEKILRSKFTECTPTIRYGGSKAKGTLILESYDLDIICYFPKDDTTAGDTLEEIYDNTCIALANDYFVEKKTSALRLKSHDPQSFARDFHIDVVPGRYVDGDDGDVFIHQNSGEKERLKTNLETHIRHVKDSGLLEPIRLLKLWKTRRNISAKQFVFELLIIDVLKRKKSASTVDQLEYFWGEIKDLKNPPSVEDPANPTGNDLTPCLTSVWPQLTVAASNTLNNVKDRGWESVFGAVEKATPSRVTMLRNAAAAVSAPTKPWCNNA